MRRRWDGAPGWPKAHFTEIINDLADHAQVILYSQFWRVDGGRTYGISGSGLDWDLDWTAPWEHLVEEARSWSLLEATETPFGDNIFVAPKACSNAASADRLPSTPTTRYGGSSTSRSASGTTTTGQAATAARSRGSVSSTEHRKGVEDHRSKACGCQYGQ
ncbi:hypothetical protein [Streptomyces sp. NBC_01643]|uniref:hypothetical protein n=1 Tax=Streptomyces sp. NBC_01643 TaxID=2975906 RepID=UPI00386BFA43